MNNYDSKVVWQFLILLAAFRIRVSIKSRLTLRREPILLRRPLLELSIWVEVRVEVGVEVRVEVGVGVGVGVEAG